MPNILRNGIIALIICTVLVILCNFYIDKPVAYFFYNRSIDHFHLLHFVTYLSTIFLNVVPFFYIVFVIRYAYQKVSRFEYVLLGAANSIVIATFIKIQLKPVFGRYWPLPWLKTNPSLLGSHAYGFHFFHTGKEYGSFPSGHAAIIVAAITIFWFCYPRFRWFYILIVLSFFLGLIGLDFHFVGDIIAGGILGGLVGYYVFNISELGKQR